MTVEPAPKGVVFTTPPEVLLPSIHASIAHAIASLPPEAHGALVGVATEAGVNAAIVAKLDDDWEVMAWIGKSWRGPIAGGAQVMKTW
jgi:hypothetical protein